jgi:hypothetical protein
VTVWRFLAEEMLRVTELVVRVVRSRWSGGDWKKQEWQVVGVVIGEVVFVSAAGPHSEYWPVIV